VAVGSPGTTREHVERVWALLREGHDWLAADFAAAAAEHAAEQERARAAAEEDRIRAEAESQAAAEDQDADLPAIEETAAVLDETDAVSPSST
jgi:aromatic-L-amino-acid decarboxylase